MAAFSDGSAVLLNAVIDEEYLTVAEAARLSKVSQSTIWRWVNQGELPAYRFGRRRVLIRRDDMKKLITPARREKGGGMTEIEKERERLSRPLSKDEQKKALAALEAAEEFSAQLRERRGGRLYPDSAETIRKMRQDRTRELS